MSAHDLSAPYVLEYPYKRSVGPVIGRFLGALRDGRIEGVRTASGRVIVPPTEYDPESGEALGRAAGDFVEVGQAGVVTTWAWVEAPRPNQPLPHPFAFALIRLDGADTALLHAVDAGAIGNMKTGMRVQARWLAHRTGTIRDIACFVPTDAPAAAAADDAERVDSPAPIVGDATTSAAPEPVRIIRSAVRLDYTAHAGRAASRFLTSVAQGKLCGQRCPSCRKVYIPPRGSCPTCGVPTEEEVRLPDTGTVTTFCVVNLPFEGQAIPIPYVAASILLDGADIALFHLIQEIPVAEVRPGLRVRAVWLPPEEWKPTTESIRYFKPTGGPDAPPATYARFV